MGREEQVEEREVLDSIFPDEIADISETSYRVSIALDIPGQDEDAEVPNLVLTVAYPESYPDVAPNLDITFPQNVPRLPQLSLPEDKPHLLSSIDETITESMGQAMVFTLISALKESAELLIGERLNEVQAEKDKEAAKAEEAENAKFHGEAVTRESFLAWRAGFRGEVEREEEERRKVEEEGKSRKVKIEEGKMSGRELWERGLVGKVDEEEEGEEDALKGVEGLKVGD
ncbi:hypothetical protein HO133_002492 [Letharia lupina]|uniref:RWD domain-containing protein n=1 Tax=Letharia lupina TaxID=560253 RepID=A0A8H6CCA6_9LECA|nr:uncharacterized protein HO133_002492 [Letharia lupina]KAF6220812.1 hypothetical protein HO133_002492 [Letharia lupina]